METRKRERQGDWISEDEKRSLKVLSKLLVENKKKRLPERTELQLLLLVLHRARPCANKFTKGIKKEKCISIPQLYHIFLSAASFFRPYFLSAEKGISQWKERENSLGHTYSDRQGEEETYTKKKKNGLGPRLNFFFNRAGYHTYDIRFKL